MACVHLTKEHFWILLDRDLPSLQLSVLVMYSPMYRYYRKWYSLHTNACHPFLNESSFLVNNCRSDVSPVNNSDQLFLLSSREKTIENVQGVSQSQTPQQPPTPRGREKMTKATTYKTNKHMHEKHIDQLPLPQAR